MCKCTHWAGLAGARRFLAGQRPGHGEKRLAANESPPAEKTSAGGGGSDIVFPRSLAGKIRSWVPVPPLPAETKSTCQCGFIVSNSIVAFRTGTMLFNQGNKTPWSAERVGTRPTPRIS